MIGSAEASPGVAATIGSSMLEMLGLIAVTFALTRKRVIPDIAARAPQWADAWSGAVRNTAAARPAPGAVTGSALRSVGAQPGLDPRTRSY
jgi:hypothetical protein